MRLGYQKFFYTPRWVSKTKILEQNSSRKKTQFSGFPCLINSTHKKVCANLKVKCDSFCVNRVRDITYRLYTQNLFRETTKNNKS